MKALKFAVILVLITPSLVFGQAGRSALNNSFKGGVDAFRLFVTNKLYYPRDARINGTIGTSIFTFGINCDTEMPFDFEFETKMGDNIEDAIINAIMSTQGSWYACSTSNSERIRIKLSFTINGVGPVAKDALAVINAMDSGNQALDDGKLIDRALKAQRKNKIDKAEKYVNQLIARYPDNSEYRQMLENLRNN
jgi:hypothetical protein